MIKDGDTLFTARRVGKTGWEYEFHPDLSEWERLRSVIDLNVRSRKVVTATENHYLLTPEQDFYEWADVIEAGKSYMVGSDVPTKDYLKSHGSYMTACSWMAHAVEWAFNNPDKKLIVETNRLLYNIYKRGNYVEIALPYHDHGGEKHWVVHNNERRKRVLVNVD